MFNKCLLLAVDPGTGDGDGVDPVPPGPGENPDTIGELPWYCDFGPDLAQSHWCKFLQSTDDQADLVLHEGRTPSLLTGPVEFELEQHGRMVVYTVYPLYMYTFTSVRLWCLSPCRCVRVFRGGRSGAGRRGGHGVSDDSRADEQPLSVVLLPRGRPERQSRPLRDSGRELERAVAHARCSLVQNRSSVHVSIEY